MLINIPNKEKLQELVCFLEGLPINLSQSMPSEIKFPGVVEFRYSHDYDKENVFVCDDFECISLEDWEAKIIKQLKENFDVYEDLL